MKVTCQEYDKVTVVELHGEFIAEFAHSFEKKMEDIIVDDMEGIVLDFSNVGYIDSRGLESLLWLRDICLSKIMQLKIAGLDDSCAKILELTRIDEKFDKYMELTEAVKSFA